MKKDCSIPRLLAAMTEPLTIGTLAKRVFLHPKHVERLVKALCNDGKAYISGWHRRDSGHLAALYSAGQGVTPLKPKARTAAQSARAYRERLKKKRPQEYQRRLAIKRLTSVKRADIAASWIPRM